VTSILPEEKLIALREAFPPQADDPLSITIEINSKIIPSLLAAVRLPSRGLVVDFPLGRKR